MQKFYDHAENLGITTTNAKYPQYGSYISRLSTYNQMSGTIPQSIEALARAGLFYAGTGDLVRCFYCGGGLRNWDTSDDPRREHKRWFPKCDFLNKFSTYGSDGKENEALTNHKHSLQLPIYINGNNQGNNNVSVTASIDNLDYIIATKAVLHLGYKREEVNRAFQICSSDNRSNVTARQILSKILELNHATHDARTATGGNSSGEREKDYDSFVDIENENITLKEKLNCKLCEQELSEVVCLPCGHLATCSDCAPAVKYCLICKVLIKATVKVYMS